MMGNERAGVPAWPGRGALEVATNPPVMTVVAGEPPPTDWARYAAAVTRHKWLVTIVTLLGTVAGFVATRFLDPRYTAKAILWIETTAQGDRGTIASEQQLLEVPGWVDLVTSNAVLDSAVRDLHLYLTAASPADTALFASFQVADRVRPGRYRLRVDGHGREFELAREDGAVVQRGRLGEVVGAGLGFSWTPPVTAFAAGGTIEFGVTAPYDAAQQLAGALKVRLEPGGNFLRLQLKGTNPALTTATVNAIAGRVVVVAAELKRQKFQELAKILQEQYDHARQTLGQAEVALKNFRVRTAGVPTTTLDAREPVVAGSFELRVELDQLRRDRRAIEQARSAEALTAIPAVARAPDLSLALQELTKKQAELRALRYRYTAESAPVRQLLAELEVLERQVIPSLTRQLVAELTVRETQLASRSDSAVRTLRRIPPLALEEARLTRDVASAEELFTNVRQRYEATRLALISSLPDVRVLDAAVEPQRPASSYGPLVILLSGAMSLGLVVMGVTIMDRVDPKVRYPEQITRGMRLTILGAVPHAGRWPLVRGDGADQVIEALRGLRLRVLHAHGAEGPLQLTVTSPGSAEGKSFVSVNLALAFADAGYRTLLIDGDVRRGAQHRVLEAARTPGLTDVLSGAAILEQAIHETGYDGLSFLSGGTRLPRAPELLLSKRLRELMAQLRTGFGVVIVDSPPLAAGVDPLVLGTATGALLLVLRAGTSDLRMAASKLEVLDTLPVRTIGAVLNGVRQGGAYRYYTYDLEGYGAVEDEAAASSSRPRVLGGRT